MIQNARGYYINSKDGGGGGDACNINNNDNLVHFYSSYSDAQI